MLSHLILKLIYYYLYFTDDETRNERVNCFAYRKSRSELQSPDSKVKVPFIPCTTYLTELICKISLDINI